MASMTGPGGQEAQTFCGFCGYTDTQRFTFCPRCGRPVGTMSGQVAMNEQTRPSTPLSPTGSEQFGSAPTQPGTSGDLSGSPSDYPTAPGGTPSGGFAGTPSGGFAGGPGWQAGAAGYPQGGQYYARQAGAQTTMGAPVKRVRSRRWRVGVTSAALLALLIVGTASAYFVYTAFFAYSPTDSARYLPSNTLFYSSFDLQQVNQNSHNVSQSDVSEATNTSGFEQATGLDFQKDVAPWVKRSFSFALVSITNQAQDGVAGSQPFYGTVFLISTHDTTASQATLQKIITTQQQKYGVKFTATSYKGTTLQSDADSVQGTQGTYSPAGTPTPLALGIVNDQVIIANALGVAEQVVDRANGNTDTLAKNTTFTNAMAKLPSGRFGTLYLNVQQLLQDALHQSNTSSQTGLDSYTVGYGSLQFTSVGMQMSFTLEAKSGTHVTSHLDGDTNASAAVVPSSAILYGGLGNLNGFYHEIKSASGGAVTDQAFTDAVGLGPDDPLFSAPVSVALLPPQAGSDDVVEPLVLLHSGLDTATTSAKVQQALQTLGFATSKSTMSGVTVTEVQSSQKVYYAVLGHDLVFSYDTYGMSQAIATFQGKQASLAGSSTFKALVGQASKNNALTVFVSLDNLANAPGQLGTSYQQLVKSAGSLFGKIKASYVTYRMDDNGITITEDIALK